MIRHIMMSPKYAKMLLRGKKLTTIRPGFLRVADKVYIHSMGRIVAVAEVREVYHKRVIELTDEEARQDCFSSKEELMSYLKRRYPGLRDSSLVTVIRFGRVEEVNMPEDIHYGGLHPVEIAKIALERLRLSQYERKILQTVIETGSLRKAAVKLYGTADKRGPIRRLLRKIVSRLYGGLEGENKSS